MRDLPDYALYTLEPASLAEALSGGTMPLADLMARLENDGATQVEFAQRWDPSAHCVHYDRVSDGAFFALRGSLRYALRVLDGCPLIYLNGNGKEASLESIQGVIRVDIGYRLSREAYAVLRRRLAQMRIPPSLVSREPGQASSAQAQRPPRRPNSPRLSPMAQPAPGREASAGTKERPVLPERRAGRADNVGRGNPQPPGGPPPRGRFMKGRPISQPPRATPSLESGPVSHSGSRLDRKHGYAIRPETNAYEGIDQYVVKDSSGSVLGRFTTRAEAESLVARLIELGH